MSEPLVLLCAWCGRHWTGQEWVETPPETLPVQAERSHGLCPDCLSRFYASARNGPPSELFTEPKVDERP